MGNTFQLYLRRSFYLHCLIFAVLLISGKVVLMNSSLLRSKNIELVEASVRVDMVAMPKYTLNELKNISSGSEEAKAQEVNKAQELENEQNNQKKIAEEARMQEEATLALETAQKKKRQDFLGKIKELSNKKVESTGNVKADKGLNGEKSSALKDLVVAGNKLNNGTAMYGSGNTANMSAFQVYVSKLPDQVRPHWRLPSFLLGKKNLKCRVRVWLNMNGEVVQSEIYQSSGDNEYDDRAVLAVKSAAPFPKLKDEFGKRAINGDIVLGFPL